jgi:dihydrodipicolinate synthase/N-acetylneuraminate lyase
MQSKIQNLKSKIQNGVIPAMATPLDESGYRVNTSAVPPLVDFLVGTGVAGLFIGGTTGEGILLEAAERQRLHEAAVAAAAGRVATLVHVGANTTAAAVALAQQAAGLGADGVVAVTPSFYPMHDSALLEYFQAIAAAAPELPLFAYDIPHQATNGVSPALLARLIEQVPTLAGLKCSRPDAQVVRELIDTAAGRIQLFAGNERIALGLLALGADGLVLGMATAVPEPAVAMVQALAAGNLAEARRQQRKMNQILDLLPAGARIGAFKAILAERGIPVGPTVPPRPMPDDWQAWAQIQAILQ